MKLSELLEGAPPARYTVDDFVSAGRRRRRRRNTGWAIAAVVAVAIVIGVPQILTRYDASPLPATPLPAYPSGTKPFDLIFSGYVSGEFRVGDPDWVSVNNQTTWIGRALRDNASAAVKPGAYRSAGKLSLYRPGFTPPGLWDTATVSPVPPIRGGRAFFADPTPVEGTRSDRMLVWQYADDALAVVTSYDRLSRDEMLRLAMAFRLSATRPARQTYSIAWVPPGLRLVAVEVGRRSVPTTVFAPTRNSDDFTIDPRVDQGELGTPSWTDPFPDSAGNLVDYAYPMSTNNPSYTPTSGVVVGAYLAARAGDTRTPVCRPLAEYENKAGSECEAVIDGDGILIARAGPDEPTAGIERMIKSGRVTGDGDRPETWKPTRESFPTSAQVPRD